MNTWKVKIDFRVFKLEDYPGFVIRTTSTSYIDHTIVFFAVKKFVKKEENRLLGKI